MKAFSIWNRMTGDVEMTRMEYLIRDHDAEKFQRKKELFQQTADFLNKKYGEGTIQAKVRDSYRNMKEQIKPHWYLIDLAENAMKTLKITPIIKPVRGGTDGARLSFKGLPCPNLCTGSRNSHGRYEFASIQQMEQVTELLIEMVKESAKLPPQFRS